MHAWRPAAIRWGRSYRPTWMDVPPMLYSGNPLPAAPGMVLFLHAILIDAARNLAMSLGHTITITSDRRRGSEPARARLHRHQLRRRVSAGASGGKKVEGRQRVSAHNMQEVLDVNVLVERTHPVRERAVDAGLNIAIAPEPSVGAPETDDRLRSEAAQLLDVLLHDTDDLAVGVDPRWQTAVGFPTWLREMPS